MTRMHRKTRSIALLLVGLLLGPPLAAAGRERAAARARGMLQALLAAAEIPGAAVAVGVGGEIVWSEGFGAASLELGAPITPETRFRAASVSKILTVAALARLAAEGRIDLDAPIQEYVPSFPDKEHTLTLRDLTGHLGGVRHYRFDDFQYDREHFDRLGDAVRIFADDPLVAEPRATYRYSTFGYTLVGAAVEHVCGGHFLTCMRQLVFDPIGMERSGGDVRSEVVAGRTAYYDRSDGGEIENARYVDPSYKWSGGGLSTTPEDLVRFGMAHLGEGFLPAELLDALFTSQTTLDGEETGVGIGWRIGEDPRGRRVFLHSGSMAGARSSLVLYPDAGLAIALMTNLGGYPAFVERTLFALAQPFLDGGATGPSPVAPGRYRYAGSYGDEAVTGAIRVEEGGAGEMTMPAPLHAFLVENGQPSPDTMEIVSIVPAAEGFEIVVAIPYGIIEIPAVATGTGFEGTMTLSRSALEFVAARE